jgi:hypothetical protein
LEEDVGGYKVGGLIKLKVKWCGDDGDRETAVMLQILSKSQMDYTESNLKDMEVSSKQQMRV